MCATLDDYFEDYQYLKSKNFESVITMAQDRVAKRYITSMLQQNNVLRRKANLESGNDRRTAAEKIKAEAMQVFVELNRRLNRDGYLFIWLPQVKHFFRKVAGDMADFDSPFDALALLSEVLKSDSDMIALDIGTLVKRYPDISQDQLICLLMLRGDLNKSDARETAQEYGPTPGALHAKSIFSQVVVTSSMNPFAGKGEGGGGGGMASSVNPFAGKDLGNLNPFSNKDSGASNNPFDSD